MKDLAKTTRLNAAEPRSNHAKTLSVFHRPNWQQRPRRSSLHPETPSFQRKRNSTLATIPQDNEVLPQRNTGRRVRINPFATEFGYKAAAVRSLMQLPMVDARGPRDLRGGRRKSVRDKAVAVSRRRGHSLSPRALTAIRKKHSNLRTDFFDLKQKMRKGTNDY